MKPETFRATNSSLQIILNPARSPKQKLTRINALVSPENRQFVAQIHDLLHRRIAFCGAWKLLLAPYSGTACRLRIGDTAEFNSALHINAFALKNSLCQPQHDCLVGADEGDAVLGDGRYAVSIEHAARPDSVAADHG